MTPRRLLPIPLLAWLLPILLFAQNPALDKDKATEIIRYNERWPASVSIVLSEPVEAPEMPGYRKVIAELQANGHTATQRTYFISKDGRQLIKASIFEIGQKPFARNVALIHLESAPSFGPASAPVSLVVFSDFECPFCATEAKMLRENALKDFPTQLRVYFKDRPLPRHPWAMDAALAGRCVYHADAQRFWDYHDWIFAHQGEVTAQNVHETILTWVRNAHMDSPELRACIESRTPESEIRQSFEDSLALEIAGTPTVFLNGRPIESGRDWDVLRAYITYELQAADPRSCCSTTPLPGSPSPLKP